MAQLQLSQVRPDFQDLVAQLQDKLAEFPTWTDLIPSSTGQALIEMDAAIGELDQYSIEAQFKETFPLTAVNNASIYAITQMLGVRLTRKSPSSMTVLLTSESDQTIAPYSTFTGAGTFFFNRVSIVLLSGVPQTVTLYQGKVIIVSINGLGTDYQAFVTSEDKFAVSDQDVLVSVDDVSIPVVSLGLWQLKGTSGVQDTTLQDGRLTLLFGSDLYGTRPATNQTVKITYAITSGTDADNLVTNGAALTYLPDSTLVAEGTSQLTGGGDELAPLVYKNIAAPLFGSFGSAVTKDQLNAEPLLYPGVVDAVLYPQRDVNPYALAWMNVVRTVLITSSVWTTPQKDAFIAWLESYSMYSSRFYLEDPVDNPVNITASVFISNTGDLSQAKLDATNALVTLFAAGPKVLGRNMYLSDIIDTIVAANSTIQYVQLSAPTADPIISATGLDAPTLAQLPSGGFIAAGSYAYGVSYTTIFGGEVPPANWSFIATTGTLKRIQVSWTGVPIASGYTIWGRTSAGTLGLIATVGSGTLTYIDDGSITPAGPLQGQSTMPVLYNTLGTVTLTMYYSTRPVL